MGQPAYPTGSDIAGYLGAFGVTPPPTAMLDAFAAAAVRRFEETAGRKMLAEAEEARIFDPPADPLLPIDDLAVLTSITYSPGGSAEVLALATDFRLLPMNAAEKGKPWQYVDFVRVWWLPQPASLRASLSILGRWGYGLTIPDDAWLAMLAAGAAPVWDTAALATLSATSGGILKEWREGNSSETYEVATADQRAAMKQQFLIDYPATVAAYTKV